MVRDCRGVPALGVAPAVPVDAGFLRRRCGVRSQRAEPDGNLQQRNHLPECRRPERSGLGEFSGRAEGGEGGEDVAGGLDLTRHVGAA